MGKPLASMTGFGRGAAEFEGTGILVEIKSVNARGLDIRMRLSSGFDVLESAVRGIIGEKLTRGAVSVFLNVQRSTETTEIVVNQSALDAIISTIESLEGRIDAKKPSLDGILALKGVLDTRDAVMTPEAEEQLHATILESVAIAVSALVESRRAEGARIGAVLTERLDEIAALTAAAEVHPARSRDAIVARLQAQVAEILEANAGLSEDRLNQEALLLATKADIREELDRLHAHVNAARSLLEAGGPVGRKLDFLAQEFNREANTLCSKSNDVSLTAIGLDLKTAIDQLREQVQNLE
jgi:uncharacterized protein (TIGR00255 family)